MRELYPPILPSYMPAFNYSDGVRVYFQLSSYNSKTQIKQAHVAVRYQSDNTSALDPSIFLTEIYATVVQEDVNAPEPYKYYIELDTNINSSEDPSRTRVIENGFQPGKIYKVQIRFSTVESDSIAPSASFLALNQENFSEWSTVCILKPIEKPFLSCKEFAAADTALSSDRVILTLPSSDAVFNATYSIPESSSLSAETLKSYRFRLYIYNDIYNTYDLIGDSKQIIFNSYNYKAVTVGSQDLFPFEYDFKMQLQENEDYKLTIDTFSKNGYELSRSYTFQIAQIYTTDFDVDINVEIDTEDAYSKVQITSEEYYSQIFILRRASSENNFQTWADLNYYSVKNQKVDVVYKDLTIKSGVFYQYGVQPVDNNGHRGELFKSNKAMGEFEYSYLLGENNQQLKLPFNVEVSNFANVVLESKVEPLGSKYPYISRNGDVKYKTFSMSGLISYHMDDQEFFTSREKSYGDSVNDYEEYNEEHSSGGAPVLRHDPDKELKSIAHPYNKMYDYIYEREFRDEVIKFLYDNKVKLFKSPTEGNILVKLMDISFTPHTELSRMIYDFSLTAHEIDEYNIDNLIYYNLLKVDDYDPDLSFSTIKLGQFSSYNYSFTDGWNFQAALDEKYYVGKNMNGIKTTSATPTYLKISFESKPYLIDMDNGVTPVGNQPLPEGHRGVMGWIINVNSSPIVVAYPNHIYEIKEDGINIQTSISFPKAVEATVDYVVELKQQPEGMDTYVAQIDYSKRMGQLFRTFEIGDNFIAMINDKYYEDSENYKRQVNKIYWIDVEADPGMVMYINGDRIVMNFTGKSRIEQDEFKQGIFGGYAVEADKINILESKPAAPSVYDAYVEDGKMYVWFKGAWAAAAMKEDGFYDLSAPIDAIINYYIQVVGSVISS